MFAAESEISSVWGFLALIVTAILAPVAAFAIAWYQEKLRQLRVRFDTDMQEKQRQLDEERQQSTKQLKVHKKTLDVIRDKKTEAQIMASKERQELLAQIDAAKAEIERLKAEKPNEGTPNANEQKSIDPVS